MTLVTTWKPGPKMWKHMLGTCAPLTTSWVPTLVVSDVTWELVPANLTNPVDVAAGQPAVYRPRPDWDMPAAHAGNAASGAVNIHRMLMAKYNDFSLASSALNTALLVSIGDVNQNILRTTFPALKPYMLTPIQIVTTMLAQHGVATGDDITKLQAPIFSLQASVSPGAAKAKRRTNTSSCSWRPWPASPPLGRA